MLRISLVLLTFGVVAALATGAAAAAPPPALLNPGKVTGKAPAAYTVAFTTTKGRFDVKVQRSLAPRGADRFYNLVRARFYDGVKFFRVLPGFVAQFGISGYPAVSNVWGVQYVVDDPVKGSNVRGSITFATSGPNSRTTQVFVNSGDNSGLDTQGFAPFGKVTKGMAVVDKLYSGYGEDASNYQMEIEQGGNAFLKQHFPKLDSVITARVV